MDAVTGVVFDLFHTLVDPEDHRPDGYVRSAAVAELLGVPVEPFVAWWDELEEERTRGRTPPNTELFARAAAEVGVEVDAGTLSEADRVYGHHQDRAIRAPRPEILDAVAALHGRGYRLAVLSNAERRDTRAWLDPPLARWFDVTVFSCDLGAVKPELPAYEAVLDALRLPASELTYVGDGGGDELTGARCAGFGRVVAARWFVPANGLRTEDEQRRAERDADAVVADVGDLLDLL